MNRERPRDTVTMGSDRNFALVFAAVFLVIAAWPLWHGGAIRLWALVVTLAFAALGFIRPSVLRPLNVAWFRFGIFISRFTTPILMTLVFAVAVVPTGLLLRLFGKDPMRRAIDSDAETYWIDRDEQPGSMKEQY